MTRRILLGTEHTICMHGFVTINAKIAPDMDNGSNTRVAIELAEVYTIFHIIKVGVTQSDVCVSR